MNARILLLPLLTILTLLTMPALASNVVVGDECDTLGTSTMTTDQKNIAVCLYDDSGDLVWKSSTSSGSSVERRTYTALSPVCENPTNAKTVTCTIPSGATHYLIETNCYGGTYIKFNPTLDALSGTTITVCKKGSKDVRITKVWPIPAGATQLYYEKPSAYNGSRLLIATPLKAE